MEKESAGMHIQDLSTQAQNKEVGRQELLMELDELQRMKDVAEAAFRRYNDKWPDKGEVVNMMQQYETLSDEDKQVIDDLKRTISEFNNEVLNIKGKMARLQEKDISIQAEIAELEKLREDIFKSIPLSKNEMLH